MAATAFPEDVLESAATPMPLATGDFAAIDPLNVTLQSGSGDSGIDSSPLITGFNDTILDFHDAIEGTADQDGTSGTVHGITGLGETIGLGHIGGDNLLTNVINAPTDIASGNPSDVTALPGDATNIGNAAMNLVDGVLSDVGNAGPTTLTAPVDQLANGVTSDPSIAPIADSPLLSLESNPLSTAANDTILGIHSALETVGDQLGVGNTVHGVTGLGETIGLGRIGDDNLLTNLGDAPSDLLAGNTSDLTALPTDLGNIVSAAGNLGTGAEIDLNAILSGQGPGVLGGLLSNVEGTAGQLLQTEGLTQTGGAVSNLATPAAVGNLLSGAEAVTGTLASTAAATLADTGNLSSTPTSLVHAVASDAANLVGSNSGASGLGSGLSNLIGSGGEQGAHNLVAVSVGPASTTGGDVNVLGTAPAQAHALDITALAVPAAAPQGISVAVAGGSIPLQVSTPGSLAPAAATAVAPHAESPIDLHAVAGLDHLLPQHIA